jgi:hypothetical protein
MKKYIFHGQIFQTNCSQGITSLRRRGLSGSPNQVPLGRTSLGKNELFQGKEDQMLTLTKFLGEK